ncbi:hypothetical protein [Accumulibacter sp.]|uniref:hypothetical protein n=1 Tax=Accumulibacter sp. TaxID=2053492 RepID=UPI00260EE0B4|nr:hypothetical protein [Accumulibacter sp.]
MSTPATFASFSLELLSPLHLGSRRAGVVAQTHRHAPGHLFVHALAATVGAARGGSPRHFVDALDELMHRYRFGPAFFIEGDRRLDDAEVERLLLASSHHVTLDGASRSAVESALFEVEQLVVPIGRQIRLCGGVWFDEDLVDACSLQHWLSAMRLGGELKIGFGRVRCDGWQAGAVRYPGVATADGDGVLLSAGELLPGAAVDGVVGVPLQPWMGRRHDPKLGFGRRLSQAVLVRMNGRSEHDARFLPGSTGAATGCWQVAA